jgi:hypothetical protein
MSSSTKPPIKVPKTIRTNVSQVVARLSWKYSTTLIANSVIGSEALFLSNTFVFQEDLTGRKDRSGGCIMTKLRKVYWVL